MFFGGCRGGGGYKKAGVERMESEQERKREQNRGKSEVKTRHLISLFAVFGAGGGGGVTERGNRGIPTFIGLIFGGLKCNNSEKNTC